MNSYRIKIFVKILLVFVIAAALFYWFYFRPVPVGEYVVSRGDVVRTVMGTGTLEAKTKVAISPKFTGLLVSVEADQGDMVKAGQKLAEFDANDLKQQVLISEAQLATVQAAIQRLNMEIEVKQANFDYAEAEFKRTEVLYTENSVSKSERDKADEFLRVTMASLKKAEIEKVETELAIRRYEEEIKLYKSHLSDSVLCALFDGIIVRRNREPGAIVNPGVSILDLVALSPLWASVWVDETEIGKLTVGQEAGIVFRSRPKDTIKGVISRISVETDRETREYLVEIEIADLPKNWVLGQRLEAYIESDRKENVLFIPTRLIQWYQNQPCVTLHANGKAVRRKIEIGLMGTERCEVTAGLNENDRIILPENGQLPALGKRVISKGEQ